MLWIERLLRSMETVNLMVQGCRWLAALGEEFSLFISQMAMNSFL